MGQSESTARLLAGHDQTFAQLFLIKITFYLVFIRSATDTEKDRFRPLLQEWDDRFNQIDYVFLGRQSSQRADYQGVFIYPVPTAIIRPVTAL